MGLSRQRGSSHRVWTFHARTKLCLWLFYGCGGRDCLKPEQKSQLHVEQTLDKHFTALPAAKRESKCWGVELSFKGLDKLFPFGENLSHMRRDAHVNWTWLGRAPWCPTFRSPVVILTWYTAGIFIPRRVSSGLSGACFAFSWRGPLGGRDLLLSAWQQIWWMWFTERGKKWSKCLEMIDRCRKSNPGFEDK